jgi:hypothetical protein
LAQKQETDARHLFEKVLASKNKST